MWIYVKDGKNRSYRDRFRSVCFVASVRTTTKKKKPNCTLFGCERVWGRNDSSCGHCRCCHMLKENRKFFWQVLAWFTAKIASISLVVFSMIAMVSSRAIRSVGAVVFVTRVNRRFDSLNTGRHVWKWEELAWVRHSSTWEERDKFQCPEAKCREKPWKRSARRFGAVGSSPDFSGFFTTFGF